MIFLVKKSSFSLKNTVFPMITGLEGLNLLKSDLQRILNEGNRTKQMDDMEYKMSFI
jgi:hypothetical protein